MSILLQIKSDQLQSRKNRNEKLTPLLTTLLTDVARIGLDDGKRETTDPEAIKVLRKYLKNNQEVINALSDGDPRIGDADYENVVITGYLPLQISDDELKAFVETLIDDQNLSTMRSMGTVMSQIEEKFSGQYKGIVASNIVRTALS